LGIIVKIKLTEEVFGLFLHIGSSKVVAAKDVVGIFDVKIKDKQCNKEFLQSAKIQHVSGIAEDYKSFIITSDAVSLSPIAPGTLKKRFQSKVFDKE
jgi:extracellular matrix regulatory protein B